MPAVVNEIVQKDFEMEIQAPIDAGRSRLRAEAGLVLMREFKEPVGRTFTAAERDYGGATCVMRAVLRFVLEGFLAVAAVIFLVLFDRALRSIVRSQGQASRLDNARPTVPKTPVYAKCHQIQP